MKGFEEPCTQALCLTGIQNHPGDWDSLDAQLSPFLKLHFPSQNLLTKGIEREEWMMQTIENEIADTKRLAVSVIIAHSFGTLRAPSVVERSSSVEIAILISPPANAITSFSPLRARTGSPMNPVEQMMWDVALDMSDADFKSFCERHASVFATEKFTIKDKFRFLKEGPSFSEMIEDYNGTAPIVIISADGDPWNIRNLPSHPKVTVQALSKDTGHYPHISKPDLLAKIIKASLHDISKNVRSSMAIFEATLA